MERHYTGRFGVVLVGAWTTLLMTALAGPTVIALGTPLIVLALVGLLWPRRSFGEVRLAAGNSLDCFERDEIALELTIGSHWARQRHWVRLEDRGDHLGIFPLTSAKSSLYAKVSHFGSVDFAGTTLVRQGPFGLFEDTVALSLFEEAKVFPAIEDLAPITRTVMAQFGIGRHRSLRRSHAGLEFVDVRQAGPGDTLTDINWRASARTGSIWLNERSTDLPLDLVVFLDTFPSGAFERRTRLAANLARAYLRNFDRVGLVIFGGTIGWLPPASGRFQERVITERLLRVRPYQSDADKRIDLLPRTALPRAATVMVVSDLSDRRIIQAVQDLEFAGHEVIAVVMERATGSEIETSTELQRLTRLLERQLLADMARLGVTVIDSNTWERHGDEINLAIER